jgi:hypothetical protein
METPAQRALPATALRAAVGAASDLLAVTHQQGSQAQLRNGFVARDGSESPLPPATELLRHSNKSGIQLRLALAFFWLAGSRVGSHGSTPPFTVRLPVRALTTLMGLNADAAADRRRTRENAHALARSGLVDVDNHRDRLAVTLRRDLPAQLSDPLRAYYRPGAAPTSTRDRRLDAYITMPPSFFADGWLTALSASALVVLLAFRYLQQTTPTTEQGLFISEHLRRERFGFSERTYYTGSLELERRGLAKSWSQHVRGLEAEGPIKVRRVFALHRHLFDHWAMTETAGAWPDPTMPPVSDDPPP